MRNEEPLMWKALEYEERRRSPDWFWSVGAIGIAGAVASFVFGNVLFGILILVGTIALVVQAIRKPRLTDFEVNNRGVRVGKTLYLYDTLEAFWVTEEENPKLLLRSTKFLMPLITVPVLDVSSADLRNYLLEHIEETEMHEPLSQKIMEYLGF